MQCNGKRHTNPTNALFFRSSQSSACSRASTRSSGLLSGPKKSIRLRSLGLCYYANGDLLYVARLIESVASSRARCAPIFVVDLPISASDCAAT